MDVLEGTKNIEEMEAALSHSEGSMVPAGQPEPRRTFLLLLHSIRPFCRAHAGSRALFSRRHHLAFSPYVARCPCLGYRKVHPHPAGMERLWDSPLAGGQPFPFTPSFMVPVSGFPSTAEAPVWMGVHEGLCPMFHPIVHGLGG